MSLWVEDSWFLTIVLRVELKSIIVFPALSRKTRSPTERKTDYSVLFSVVTDRVSLSRVLKRIALANAARMPPWPVPCPGGCFVYDSHREIQCAVCACKIRYTGDIFRFLLLLHYRLGWRPLCPPTGRSALPSRSSGRRGSPLRRIPEGTGARARPLSAAIPVPASCRPSD